MRARGREKLKGMEGRWSEEGCTLRREMVMLRMSCKESFHERSIVIILSRVTKDDLG